MDVDESVPRSPRLRGSRDTLNSRHSSLMALSTVPASPRWSMLGRTRPSSIDRRPLATPDPCTYNPLDPGTTSKMNRSPKASFGSRTSPRKVLEQEKELAPGPGAYNHESRDDLGQIPRCTSASINTPRQRERTSRQTTPDPTCYRPSDSAGSIRMGRSPSYGFGSSRASRFPTLKERAPGPGSYVQRVEIGKEGVGSSFLNSPRPSQREPKSVESAEPATYSVPDPTVTSKMSRPFRASMTGSNTGRLESSEKSKNPGPGQYDQKDVLAESGAALTFERYSPRKTGKVRRSVTPDPGQYAALDPAVTSKMNRQAAAHFSQLSTGRSPENGDSSPVADGDGSNGDKSARRSTGSKKDVPGPGAYELGNSTAAQVSAPQYGFGSYQARPSAAQQPGVTALQYATPGPGTYVSSTSVGVGPKFTMRGRPDSRTTSTPGPGAYGGNWTQFVP